MKHFRATLAALMVFAALIACSTNPPAPAASPTALGATQGPAATSAATTAGTPSAATNATALPSASALAETPTAQPPVTDTAPPPSPTPAAQVLSDDGQAQLIIPPDALPAGVSLADIHIKAVDPQSSKITSDGQPALAVYAFEPNGLVFATPAQLVLTLPLPANRRLPLMLSLSSAGAEWLTGVEYTLAADTGQLMVSVPVKHFSTVSTVLGFFTATIADPADQLLNKPFDVPVVVARVRTSITTTTETGEVISTTSTAAWSLSGKLTATRTVGPRTVANAPASTSVAGHQFSFTQTYACKSVGPASIIFEATLKAETTTAGLDVAANYPIKVTTRPFKCLDTSATGTSGGAGQPPVLTHFKAVFNQNLFSTFYEITATDPANKGLKYFWSLSETCGDFIWDSQGGSPKAQWSHPHPPCPPIKGHHPGQIAVRVVDAAGAESIYIYGDGSADGDIDLTKLTAGTAATATPTPAPK